jgi:hypothetical protein
MKRNCFIEQFLFYLNDHFNFLTDKKLIASYLRSPFTKKENREFNI